MCIRDRLQTVGHVEVVEEGAEVRVVVENGVGESDHDVVMHGDDGALSGESVREAGRPHPLAVGENVTVEVRVGEGTSIVAPPALGVQSGDGVDIPSGGFAICLLYTSRCV